jgi:hypothetical protein
VTVRLEDPGIAAPDDHQRRCLDVVQRVAREIRSAAAGYDGAHRFIAGRGDQRCGGAGARAEQPNGKTLDRVVFAHPVEGGKDAVGEQPDVEPEFSGA